MVAEHAQDHPAANRGWHTHNCARAELRGRFSRRVEESVAKRDRRTPSARTNVPPGRVPLQKRAELSEVAARPQSPGPPPLPSSGHLWTTVGAGNIETPRPRFSAA